VVATHARVDVSNKFATVGDGDAPLQDAGCGVLEQLAVDYSERLGFPGDAPGFGRIRGEFPLINPGELLGPPIVRVGGRLRFHSLGFVRTVPLE
jgi:hypothetical protein